MCQNKKGEYIARLKDEIWKETPMSQDAFQALTGEAVTLRHYEVGANILRVEDRYPGVHVIVDGSLIIWKPVSVSTASRLYICRRFPGELIGEMEVLSPAGTLGAATAATEAYTLHMDADHFQEQISKYPELHLWLASQLVTKVRDTNRHFEAILMRSAEARIADDFLLQARRIGKDVGDGKQIPFGTQKALGDYLHTDVASISRILDRWQKAGVLTKGENILTIHDLDALQSARDR